MLSRHLGVLALAAALIAPLAASAQTAPVAPPAGASAPVAPGQHHHHHRRHHRNGFGKALKSLGLSDAQKTQIAGIMKTNRANMQNAKTADPAARRANMQALRGQIDAVLTPPQRAQLQASLAKHRNGNGKHGPAPMASPQ